MVRVVALDLGGVLSWPAELYTAPAALLGVDPDAYEAAYWTQRRELDIGLPPGEYYGRLLAAVGLRPAGELVDHLAHFDMALWCRFRPTARALLETVAAWEQRLVIVSNAPASLRQAAEESDWYPLVERLFISGELGTVKPEAELYAGVTAALGVQPGEIAFIDDRPANVAAATEFGWLAHEWVDDSDSLAWLRQVAGHPAP
ncbi:MAG: HAD-IA family hydrolase [Propionicimonas sp.]|nr:HAD-IA family hydrolase [Propionicimonas sp.]